MSDKPEGPFKLLSQYKYDPEDAGDDGIYNDAGVLVDDDGRVYIYYGFTESNFNEIDPADMYTIKREATKERSLMTATTHRRNSASLRQAPRGKSEIRTILYIPHV